MSDINNRPFEYKKDICWQYDIRQKNLQYDLNKCILTSTEVNNLKVSDFYFTQFTKEDVLYKEKFKLIKEFIERHEWLGKMSLYPTHYFMAFLKRSDELAGVVVMDVPATFSKILGDETRKIERLISRGACISWSPKNLASSLIMYSIRWMVKNTRFRLFTAYSDPEAKELGTIYQACNFLYMGNSYGTLKKYRYKGTDKWFSDRSFRTRSAYKRYSVKLNIDWQDNWNKGSKILWSNIPNHIEILLRNESKAQYNLCEFREVPKKHKYCYILGRTKKETRRLKDIFYNRNQEYFNISYPKER